MKYLLLTSLLITAGFAFSATRDFEQLSSGEKEKLQQKEIVFEQSELPNHPWPQMTFYSLIDLPVREAIAIFSRYQDHKKFVPNLIKSVPIRKVSPQDTHVAFELQTPWPLPNSKYTTGNVLKKIGDNGYEVSWYLVNSNTVDESSGRAIFMDHNGKTLLIYQTLVVPQSIFASLVKETAKKDMLQTVRAISNYLEQTKSSPELLAQYLKELEANGL